MRPRRSKGNEKNDGGVAEVWLLDPVRTNIVEHPIGAVSVTNMMPEICGSGVFHIFGYLGVRDCVFGVGEGAFVFDLARGTDKGSEGCASKGTSYADSFGSSGCQLLNRVGCTLKSHENVDGFGDAGADLTDGVETG